MFQMQKPFKLLHDFGYVGIMGVENAEIMNDLNNVTYLISKSLPFLLENQPCRRKHKRIPMNLWKSKEKCMIVIAQMQQIS